MSQKVQISTVHSSIESVSSSPVLVFDSGMGGLSVVEHLRTALPQRALAYACDNAALPYGTKQDDWLVKRIVTVCCQAIRQSGANTLVVACNTASTLALPMLRDVLDIPVVGTVPAIKPAAQMTRQGVIGLLATSATLNRPYTEDLIQRFAQGMQVVRVSGDALVMQAERLLAGFAPDIEIIRSAIAPLFEDPKLDTVVLGCTHFPLLRSFFERLAPRPIQWVDSGAAIAQRTAQVSLSGGQSSFPEPSFATDPDRNGLDCALTRHAFASPVKINLSDDFPPAHERVEEHRLERTIRQDENRLV